MRLWNRIRFFSARERLDRELADEILAHREMLEERYTREGMTPREAREAAARQFGSDLSSREQSREEWGFGWLDAVLRDCGFAVRLIRHRPMLTLAAVLTVGLGVGANTAVVSVLQTVLLNPLGLRDSGKVLVATVRLEQLQMRQTPTSGVEFRELSTMTDAFSAVAASEGRTWTILTDGGASRLAGNAVTPDFFRVFGERPRAGRFFTPEDRESVVLSHGLWKAQFGGEDTVIGRVMMLDGQPHRIVGVAPASFRFPVDAQAWTPLVLSPARLRERGNNMNLAIFARLKEGVTPAQAEDRVNRYVAALKSPVDGEAPAMAKLGYFVDLEPFAGHVAGDLRRPLWLLWAAALAVLFNGCATVAALLLSRVAGRKREMAIRLSLGATRLQILRQLLVESLLLGALGGAFGVLVAAGALSLLTRVSIPGRRLLELVTLDSQLMLYGLALALASGLVFGLAPAVQLLRESQSEAIRRGARHGFQNLFVTAQVAAALMLLVGTGLLLRSFWALQQVRPGFDPAHVGTAYFIKPKDDPGFITRLETRLASSPGVQSSALAFPLPFTSGGLTSRFRIKGRERKSGEPEWHGEAYFVSSGYFPTLRIPLVRGRGISPSDEAQAPVICVIDTNFAERFFPGRDPIGQEIAMYRGWARIEGVVGAIRASTLEKATRPVVYYPLVQVPFFPQAAALVRSNQPAGGLIREAVRQTSASTPVFDERDMEDRISESLGIRRVVAVLVCTFGVICLLLATVGLHGVVAQVVSDRTPEIGLRMALGARPEQILAQFLGRGLAYGGIGIVVGLAGASYAQRWLSGMLYEVKPSDPLTFYSASAGVLLILVLAVLWPARRASRIDPQSVLRYE